MPPRTATHHAGSLACHRAATARVYAAATKALNAAFKGPGTARLRRDARAPRRNRRGGARQLAARETPQPRARRRRARKRLRVGCRTVRRIFVHANDGERSRRLVPRGTRDKRERRALQPPRRDARRFFQILRRAASRRVRRVYALDVRARARAAVARARDHQQIVTTLRGLRAPAVAVVAVRANERQETRRGRRARSTVVFRLNAERFAEARDDVHVAALGRRGERRAVRGPRERHDAVVFKMFFSRGARDGRRARRRRGPRREEPLEIVLVAEGAHDAAHRDRQLRAPRGGGEDRAAPVLVRADGRGRARELQRRARGAHRQTPGTARGASRETHRGARCVGTFHDEPIRRGRGTLFGARFFR